MHAHTHTPEAFKKTCNPQASQQLPLCGDFRCLPPFHQKYYLQIKHHFPTSFLVLKTCKTTCCRIFETNMRLRPRHLLSRVPKTTSRFNDSQNSDKLLYPPTVVITGKGYRLKLAKEKSTWNRNQEKPGARHPGVLSQGNYMDGN